MLNSCHLNIKHYIQNCIGNVIIKLNSIKLNDNIIY